jgi:hypothetical protein
MMQTSHLLTIKGGSQTAVDLVAKALKEAGLQVVQSFDLQAAKAAHSQCTCPHHGTNLCDCQMIMLLVYDLEDKPITLVAHGQDGSTHLGLINDPSRRNPARLVDVIRKALTINSLSGFEHNLWSNAT